jgi:hypothetical protein
MEFDYDTYIKHNVPCCTVRFINDEKIEENYDWLKRNLKNKNYDAITKMFAMTDDIKDVMTSMARFLVCYDKKHGVITRERFCDLSFKKTSDDSMVIQAIGQIVILWDLHDKCKCEKSDCTHMARLLNNENRITLYLITAYEMLAYSFTNALLSHLETCQYDLALEMLV